MPKAPYKIRVVKLFTPSKEISLKLARAFKRSLFLKEISPDFQVNEALNGLRFFDCLENEGYFVMGRSDPMASAGDYTLLLFGKTELGAGIPSIAIQLNGRGEVRGATEQYLHPIERSGRYDTSEMVSLRKGPGATERCRALALKLLNDVLSDRAQEITTDQRPEHLR